ncbi:DUF6777 domain-containing protein [Streptomyces tritici]|uniref:DUF6777 domain-containing protein n=1 Tax=Streptomyces tritici TaxID=2054410 RepID=UPI003AF1DD46
MRASIRRPHAVRRPPVVRRPDAVRLPLAVRRPHVAVLAVLASAALIGGCATARVTEQPAAADSRDVLLQPLADQGPNPFTDSAVSTDAPTPPPGTPEPSPTASVQVLREITGSTPGLYGGTRAESSCDVERQVAHLTAEPALARAFAEGAGINEANLANWLRELTPVVLRADTRVTNHGYRDGAPVAFQSVLQAGTAVLVDRYGTPRVRCACGNPLRSPVDVRGAKHTGRPWPAYHPDRVVVVRPTTTVITSLVIVDVVHDTWIERKTGTDGDEDRSPAVVPPCEPDDCDLVPVPPAPDTSDAPEKPTSPAPSSPSPKAPKAPRTPDAPESPESPVTPDAPPAEPEGPAESEVPPGFPEDLFPSAPEGEDGGVVPPGLPETFEG